LNNDHPAVATGIFKGIKTHWNPLVNDAYILVDVGGTMIKVPLDRRQLPFLEKEYAVGDTMEIYFDGVWHVKSRPIEGNEYVLPDDLNSIF